MLDLKIPASPVCSWQQQCREALVAEQQLSVRSSEGSSAALRREGRAAVCAPSIRGALPPAPVLLQERSASGLRGLKARILAARGAAGIPFAELSKELTHRRAIFDVNF